MARRTQAVPNPVGSQPAFIFPVRMKKHATTEANTAKPGRAATAALDLIVKNAYRRHTRGRIACAAVTSCLGA